jgi:hypothetical protein
VTPNIFSRGEGSAEHSAGQRKSHEGIGIGSIVDGVVPVSRRTELDLGGSAVAGDIREER